MKLQCLSDVNIAFFPQQSLFVSLTLSGSSLFLTIFAILYEQIFPIQTDMWCIAQLGY